MSAGIALDLSNTNYQLLNSLLGLTISTGVETVAIENVFGTDHADSIFGNSSANSLQSGAGNDLLKGGDGGDACAAA